MIIDQVSKQKLVIKIEISSFHSALEGQEDIIEAEILSLNMLQLLQNYAHEEEQIVLLLLVILNKI